MDKILIACSNLCQSIMMLLICLKNFNQRSQNWRTAINRYLSNIIGIGRHGEHVVFVSGWQVDRPVRLARGRTGRRQHPTHVVSWRARCQHRIDLVWRYGWAINGWSRTWCRVFRCKVGKI